MAVAGVKRTRHHQSLQRVPIFQGFVPRCFAFADGLPEHQNPGKIGGELFSWHSEFPEGLGWWVRLRGLNLGVSVSAPLPLRKGGNIYITPLIYYTVLI